MKIAHEGSDPPKRLAAVITPVVKFPLSAEEEISLRHLREYLGGFDRYIIGPQRLPKEFSDFTLLRFPPRYFADRYDWARLIFRFEPFCEAQRSPSRPFQLRAGPEIFVSRSFLTIPLVEKFAPIS